MALAQQEGQEQLTHSRTRQWLTLGAVVLLTGMGAGLGGMLLAMLLHGIQHLAYGYGQDSLTLHDSFLTGVSSASPERRVLVLTLCGLVAGLGWWLLYRFGRPLVSIKKAVMPGAADMPAKSTLVHALLQIVTVALGSPLGREVAPREVGALVGAWLSRKAGLPDATHRLMIACGAGAGLAAVYNVPLGGAIFVLEVLVGSFGAGDLGDWCLRGLDWPRCRNAVRSPGDAPEQRPAGLGAARRAAVRPGRLRVRTPDQPSPGHGRPGLATARAVIAQLHPDRLHRRLSAAGAR